MLASIFCISLTFTAEEPRKNEKSISAKLSAKSPGFARITAKLDSNSKEQVTGELRV